MYRLTAIKHVNPKKGAAEMLVYVLSKTGQPLMPMKRCGKVRRLLKEKKAKVVKRCPFTIQLLFDTEENTQPIDLGIDSGSKTIGVSACTWTEELYAAEVELRTDITNNLSTRRELRRRRRCRKTRYRKPRFENRVKSKNKGWLPPSVESKIQTHFRAVEEVMSILPVTRIRVEVAAFDIQKIKAMKEGKPLPSGTAYQRGEQYGFWNAREYVLYRDGHKCRCCKGKSGDKILSAHHIESRKTGGDAPNNLVTLCEYCHTQYHKGKVNLPKDVQRGASYRDAAFMITMRWEFYERLRVKYPGRVSLTYGYITKRLRIKNGLPKTHAIDARVISKHPHVKPGRYCYYQKKVRCHNRQLHKAKILKGGLRKSNQAAREVFGFRLFDRVRFNGQECFVFGRRSSGSFDVRLLDGTKLIAGVSYKKLKLIEHSKTVLTERRPA